jgi:hypothetical protein
MLLVMHCLVPSCYSGGRAFSGDAKQPGLDIWWRVDRMDTCVTESLNGVDCFNQGILILCQRHHMMFMRVSLVKLLCQAMMGWVSALEYLLSDALGSHNHISSCKAPKTATSRGHGNGSVYPLLKAPDAFN